MKNDLVIMSKSLEVTDKVEMVEEVIEGFICPVCRLDLKSLGFLTEHFEKFHDDEQEAFKSIFRDIFIKAKKRIKFNFVDTSELSRNIDCNIGISSRHIESAYSNSSLYVLDMNQEVGVERCHKQYYESIRKPRMEHYASEANKLIIRLQRLLQNIPKDSVMRKQHEQNIVTWLDGTSVKLCPYCAKSFHITRRQHHCRLCGSIICQDCSKFLSMQTAIELSRTSLEHECPRPENKVLVQEHFVIRSCIHCLWLLETRQIVIKSSKCNIPITKIYNEIQWCCRKMKPDIEEYSKIVFSLYEGESLQRMNDARILRRRIGQMAETIDILSQRILKLPIDTNNSKAGNLQKSIRLSYRHWIYDNVLNLPSVPKEEEITKIRELKLLETEKQIANDQKLAMKAYERYGVVQTFTMIQNPQKECYDYIHNSDFNPLFHWCGHNINDISIQNDDPIIEQINIIKTYIKQACEDENSEVVETLESNLKELQHELCERQKSSAFVNNISDA